MTRPIQPHEVESIWQEIRAQLEERKQQIYDEIKRYPPPIPACDQHFNYLLEERSNIARELTRLEACAKESLTSEDARELIDAFVASSMYLGVDARQKLS